MESEISGLLGSPEDTIALASALGGQLTGPVVIALIGEMGSGKTTFVRGLAQGLEVSDVVNSPTYALMQRYEGRLRLDHYDAWMEGREREVLADGAHELLGLEGVSVIEWADRVSDLLPDDRLEVRMDLISQDERRITVKWVGEHVTEQGQECLNAILALVVPESASDG